MISTLSFTPVIQTINITSGVILIIEDSDRMTGIDAEL